MRVAFYAPMKPPDHPVPSGDRTMARGLIAALEHADHNVRLASRFRSFDNGDPARQQRLEEIGGRLAERLLLRLLRGARPDVWFTYHLYHKAPDWLGPTISRRLGIPYVLAEASYAPKQAGGRWDIGHRAAGAAIGQAALIFQPNPVDAACVLPLLRSQDRMTPLPPFLDTFAFRAAERSVCRVEFAEKLNLDAAEPWLLTVAMMRNDQKLVSYRRLAAALARLMDLPWRLIVSGAGPAEAEVRASLHPLGDRVRFAGMPDPDSLQRLYRSADLYVWPAVKEAWGMTLLEAQSAGVPVVAGNGGGVPAVVADGETGLLAPEGDDTAFAEAARELLTHPGRRRAMGRAASARMEQRHDISVAARLLDAQLAAIVKTAVA
jgi:glycosyltransferase involved in cell wall biosynthesis